MDRKLSQVPNTQGLISVLIFLKFSEGKTHIAGVGSFLPTLSGDLSCGCAQKLIYSFQGTMILF